MENLKSFLDKELDLASQTEVEAQLRNQPELEAMAKDFSSMSAIFKTVDPGVPHGLEQLEKRLSQGATPKSSSKGVWKFSAISSVLGLCLVLLVVSNSGSLGSSRGETASTVPSTSKGVPESSVETKDVVPGDQMYVTPEAGSSSASAPNISSRTAPMSDALAKEGKYSFRSERIKAPMPSSGNNGSLQDPKGIYLERSGDVSVRVEDLMRSSDEIVGIAKSFDGFVTQSNLSNEEKRGTATMTLRVPTQNFAAAVNRIQTLGETISVNSMSNDITGETVDNTSRMEFWAVEEQRLIAELKRTRNSNEMWRVRQELSNVRANLQAFRDSVKSLRDRAKFSTLNVSLVRSDDAGFVKSNWSDRAFDGAKGGLGSIGKIAGTLAIYAVVFIPIWLPFLVGYLVIRKRSK
jgi:hypothetical protein